MIFHTRLLFWFPDAHVCPGSVQSVQSRHFPAAISGVIIALSECPLLLTFQSSLTSIISDLVRQGVLYNVQLFEHPGNFVFSSVQWDGPWVYLMELLWRLNELIHARCLKQDQAQSEYHVGAGCHFFFIHCLLLIWTPWNTIEQTLSCLLLWLYMELGEGREVILGPGEEAARSSLYRMSTHSIKRHKYKIKYFGNRIQSGKFQKK